MARVCGFNGFEALDKLIKHSGKSVYGYLWKKMFVY